MFGEAEMVRGQWESHFSPNSRLQPGATTEDWEIEGKLRAVTNDQYILPSPAT